MENSINRYPQEFAVDTGTDREPSIYDDAVAPKLLHETLKHIDKLINLQWR